MLPRFSFLSLLIPTHRSKDRRYHYHSGVVGCRPTCKEGGNFPFLVGKCSPRTKEPLVPVAPGVFSPQAANPGGASKVLRCAVISGTQVSRVDVVIIGMDGEFAVRVSQLSWGWSNKNAVRCLFISILVADCSSFLFLARCRLVLVHHVAGLFSFSLYVSGH